MRGHLAISVVTFLMFAAALVYAGVNSQPQFQFNVTPDSLNVNWSNNFKINITINVTNSTVDQGLNISIVNSSATLRANYSQPVTSYGTVCGDTASGIKIIVGNETEQTFKNVTSNITNRTTGEMTLYMHQACPAGRYFGHINITNGTAGSFEYVQLNITYNIPISTNNTLSNSTGLGSFSGILPANASAYQSYFFNTSSITNSSGIYVNLSWTNSSAADVDIFLLNSTGGLLARSANKAGSESLFYNYLGPASIYEIRLYGNSSSAINYTDQGGWIYVSTLNITNSSNRDQRVQELSYLGAGVFNISNTSNYTNFTIFNNGSINFSSVAETRELYRYNVFGGNGSANFTLMVPGSSIATRLQALINYTGGANYTIKLYNPSGTLVDSSYSRKLNANMSNVETEDYVQTTSVTSGLWRVEIVNTTSLAIPYNVTIRTYVNASDFITTNYSTMSIPGREYVNSTVTFHVNLTIPSDALNGAYLGHLKYSTSSGEVARLAVRFNATVPEFSVNNTFSSGTYTLIDNVGFNRTLRNHVNISINNTGDRGFTILNNLSDLKLRHTSNSSLYVDFNFSYPSSQINARSTANLTLNFTIDTTNTTNTAGIYRGYIFLNTTDTGPYQGYNLTVDVNLSTTLSMNINNIILPTDGPYAGYITNASKENNISVGAKVYFVNDSSTILNITNINNFTSAYLISGNVTSYRYPSSGSLDYGNYTTELALADFSTEGYKVNVTVPANLPGGNYSLFMTVSNARYGGITYTGVSSTTSVYVNNTGLYLQANSSVPTVAANGNGYYNISVINYGSVDSTGTITPVSSDTTKATVVADTVYSHTNPSSPGNCGTVASGGGSFNGVVVSAHAAEVCIYQVKITGKNITTSASITLNLTASARSYGSHTATIDISGTGSSSSSNSGSSSSANDSTPTPSKQYKMKLSIPERIEIVQGSQKSMVASVNNTGDTGLTDVTLGGSGIDSSWFTTSPSSYALLGVGDEKNFTVTYKIPASAQVKDYNVTLNASNPNNYTINHVIVRVLPSESTKNGTNGTLLNVSGKIKELEDRIGDLKNSTLEAELTAIKDKLAAAQVLANNGDYFGAIQKIDEVNSEIESLSEKISNAESTQGNGIGLKAGYIVMGIIALLFVGTLAYLLVPPKEGYHPEKGFKYLTKEDKKAHEMTKSAVEKMLSKIKSFFMKKE